jgi:hypothetical protein
MVANLVAVLLEEEDDCKSGGNAIVIVVGTPMVGLEIVNYTPCVSKN